VRLSYFNVLKHQKIYPSTSKSLRGYDGLIFTAWCTSA